MLSNIKQLFVSVRFKKVNTADIGMEANLHSSDILSFYCIENWCNSILRQ